MAVLKLPPGTPRQYPPYPGATKNWAPRTLQTVRKVQDKAPGIVCATYAGHGRTGEPFGIDIMISPFNQKPDPQQAALGAKIARWAFLNWQNLNLNYIIWWNQMNDGNGWFDYEPLRLDWIRQSGSSPNVITSRHFDHVHLQVDSPNIAGNE